MIRCAVLAAGLALIAGALAPAADNTILHKPAPQIDRRDLTGKTMNLRRYRGKVVLLTFWATWCAPCQEELPRFDAWQRRYGVEGFQVVAVSMDDDAGPVRTLMGKMKLDFPVVLGDAAIGHRYGGILGLPVTFLIGRDGRVEARYAGDAQLTEMEAQVKRLLERR